MSVLLHPAYFPNILTFAVIVQNDVIWEVMDNYQKQTFRNRCHICTDQGRHMLNIPIKHVGGNQGRQATRDVLLDNSYPWQRQHWRTLQTAYRTSPFFEFYEDDLEPLFRRAYRFLLDFNLKTIEIMCDCLGIEMPARKTQKYHLSPEELTDARFLINAKKDIRFKQKEYTQVFGARHGFIKNTSVLDLLFNEGTLARDYLQEAQTGFQDA